MRTSASRALFFVLLAIVAHRFLRFDLVNDTVASLRPQAVLTVLLGATLASAVLLRQVPLWPGRIVAVQGALWAWALVTKVVSDGSSVVLPYLRGDYAKDVVFAALLSLGAGSVRRLRVLALVFVAALLGIAAVTVPQHTGVRQCYSYAGSSELNYQQETDGRLCVAAADCYALPKSEAHLRDRSWACERTGSWGLATVLGRIHYVGNLMDPNALALALVMAVALGLGLLLWPPGEGAPGLAGRAALLLALGLLSLSVVYAASRAGQIALLLAVLCFFYTRIGWAGAIALGLCGLPLALLSSRNEAEAAYSTLTRALTYLNGYRAFLDSPLFGVGYGNYERISFINAHSSFLLAVTETGLVGGVLFLLGVYLSFKCVLTVMRWPVSPVEDLPAGRELLELRHLSRMLFAMLAGVLWCVFFLSLAFDVMWLFPVGIVAAFHRAAQRVLPGYALRLSLLELGLVAVAGALLPALLVAIATRAL